MSINKEALAMIAALLGQGLTAQEAVRRAVQLLDEADEQAKAYNKRMESATRNPA